MNSPNPRLPWIDAVRGLAILAMGASITRSMLHPVGASYRPQDGTGGLLWWMLVETFLDQTGVWLFAIAAGIALAAKRTTLQDDRQWTIEHRARALTLVIAGLAHAYYVFPQSILPAGLWACLFVSKAVRENECRPIRAAAITAVLPILLMVYDTTNWDRYLSEAGTTWTDRFEISTTAFDTWETASYTGPWAEQDRVRHHQWMQAQTSTTFKSTLWQMTAGIFFGLWWYRAGRHRRHRKKLAGELAATGIMMNAAAAVLAQYPLEPGLMMRIADQLNYIGGALLAAGICIALTITHDDFWERPAARTVSRIGNCTLTAYVLWTTGLAGIGTGLGLGLHGRLSPVETAIVWMGGCTIVYAAAQHWTSTGPGPGERIWRRTAKALIEAATPD